MRARIEQYVNRIKVEVDMPKNWFMRVVTDLYLRWFIFSDYTDSINTVGNEYWLEVNYRQCREMAEMIKSEFEVWEY
jgi:hypothetical protein